MKCSTCDRLSASLAASERARREDANDHLPDMALLAAKVRTLEAENARLREALVEIATGTKVWTRAQMIDYAEAALAPPKEAPKP